MTQCLFFLQAEDGIRDLVRSRGLGDVYKRQGRTRAARSPSGACDATAHGREQTSDFFKISEVWRRIASRRDYGDGCSGRQRLRCSASRHADSNLLGEAVFIVVWTCLIVGCLLSHSDAAHQGLSVNLCGRRLFEKKKTKQ